jgi:hypothetical protein
VSAYETFGHYYIQSYKHFTLHQVVSLTSLNCSAHARYDCGYFMLKFIELWNGRKMIAALNPMDMPIIRKQLTLKWSSWVENKIAWQELLF